MKPLNGKTVLVTGAAGTMGLAATRVLLEDGARVAMVDLSESHMINSARGLQGEIMFVAADIRDANAVTEAHQQITDKFGAIDILVNNAGILSNNKIAATTDVEWRQVLSVNLDGAFHWSRAVLPGMKSRQWGRIINVSSLAAIDIDNFASNKSGQRRGEKTHYMREFFGFAETAHRNGRQNGHTLYFT